MMSCGIVLNQEAWNVESKHAHQHHGLDFLDLLGALVDTA
jgi:hypothetical protein